MARTAAGGAIVFTEFRGNYPRTVPFLRRNTGQATSSSTDFDRELNVHLGSISFYNMDLMTP